MTTKRKRAHKFLYNIPNDEDIELIKKFAKIAVEDTTSMELLCRWYCLMRFPMECLREYVPEYYNTICEYMDERICKEGREYELVKNIPND